MSKARKHLKSHPGYALDELRPLSVEQALSAGLATPKGNKLLASPMSLAQIPDLKRRLPSPHNEAVVGTLRKAMEAEGYHPDSTIYTHAAMTPDGPALVVSNGFRRLTALDASSLRLDPVPVRITPLPYTPPEVWAGQLTDDQGEKLATVEQAYAVHLITDIGGWAGSRLAELMDVSNPYISRLRNLGAAGKPMLTLISKGIIAQNTALTLLRQMTPTEAIDRIMAVLADQEPSPQPPLVTLADMGMTDPTTDLRKHAHPLYLALIRVQRDPAYGQIEAGTRKAVDDVLAATGTVTALDNDEDQ